MPASASPLVRTLGEWAPADADAPESEFAGRVSHWLGALDAIALQTAHQAIRSVTSPAGPAAARARVRPRTATTLAQGLEQARGVLAKAIAQPVDAREGADGFTPYRNRHAELQRQMALMITPLRAHARDALSARSARLRQLAMLDATMEQVLAVREQTLLAKLPSLLKSRFDQLRAAPRRDEDDTAWLQAFEREWRQALMAELDVRLAPVTGLVEAAANERDDTR